MPIYRPIRVAKGLLILSYMLLYLLLSLSASIAVWEPLFQVIFHLLFILFATLTYEPMYTAFLQALGNSRVDSALRRIGGVATLVDNLHEYSELDGVLRYTQSSLSVLLGGGTVHIWIARTLMDSGNDKSEQFLSWSMLGSTALDASTPIVMHALEEKAPFTRDDAPALANALDALHVNIVMPVLRNNRELAIVLLQAGTMEYAELKPMLAFFTRQFAIALERIDNEQQARNRQARAFAEKSAALATLSATIAHEMRTPLSGVRASISGVDAYLPDLISGYRYAHAQKPQLYPYIRDELLEALGQTGPRVRAMVDQANHVIDLLLVNLNDQQLDPSRFARCSVVDCVEEALSQYPFKRLEREKIDLFLQQDFAFLGIQSLMVYVLFNLLKNALYSLESAGRGRISIRTFVSENSHTMVFEDTGLGIEEAIQSLIFDGFFSTRSNGTGAGLAFCKRTMKNFGGDIVVVSEVGKFTRFTLSFPPVLSEEI